MLPWRLVWVALLAGLALGLPRGWAWAAPLQLLGLACWGRGLARCPNRARAALFGLSAGLAEAVAIFLLVRVQPAALLVLGGGIVLVRLLTAWAGFSWQRRPLALAATWTLVEYAHMLLVPLFGTTTLLGLGWSAYPALIQHEAVVGIAGSVFLLAWFGLALGGLAERSRRHPMLVHLAAALLVAGSLGWWARGRRTEGETWQVAVAGASANLHGMDYFTRYQPLAEQVERSPHPRLLVTPELGWLTTAAAGRHLRAASRDNGLVWVAGVYDQEARANQAWIAHPQADGLGVYTKNHLVPFMEYYSLEGDGRPFRAGRLGVMICHDDNFTDLAADAARGGARLIAIPTHDWPGVEAVHLANMRHRALETGCVLARATHAGYSAIVAPDGRLLACDPGPVLLQSEVRLQAEAAPYVRLGDGPLLGACLALLAGAVALARRKAAPPA